MIRWPSIFSPAFVVCLMLLIGGGGVFRSTVAALRYQLTKRPIEAELKLPSLPMETEGWRCISSQQLAAEMLEELGTQNYVTRAYVRVGGATKQDPSPTELHAAYYTGMIDTVPHVPDRCLVGAGFTISGGTRNIPLNLDLSKWNRSSLPGGEEVFSRRSYQTREVVGADGSTRKVAVRPQVRLPRGIEHATLRVTEFIAPEGGHKLQAGYLFIANGKVAGSAEEVRTLSFDLRAEYAYYLKLQFSGMFDSAEDLVAHASSLLTEVLPDVMLCVPDWHAVEAGDYPVDNPRRAKVGSGESSIIRGSGSAVQATRSKG